MLTERIRELVSVQYFIILEKVKPSMILKGVYIPNDIFLNRSQEHACRYCIIKTNLYTIAMLNINQDSLTC